ncbi:MAG: ABC transporter ATP-binding protein [Candidatus Eisenbacteria bacterium]
MPDSLLTAQRLSAGYGDRPVFQDVSFSLGRGTLVGLVGPNGSGKTTLLHTLCGIHPALRGEVRCDDRPLTALSRKEIARRIALVPQSVEIDFHVTVNDTIALGRYPWLGPLAPLNAADERAVGEALDALELRGLRDRSLQTLSGGERQRVFLARALAQDTPLLLLDEPAASLDLRYQQEIFARLHRLAAEREVAILVADHHLNLVAAVCDRLLVLHENGLWADGKPEDIISAEMIRTVFGARMRVYQEAGGRPQCVWDF